MRITQEQAREAADIVMAGWWRGTKYNYCDRGQECAFTALAAVGCGPSMGHHLIKSLIAFNDESGRTADEVASLLLGLGETDL